MKLELHILAQAVDDILSYELGLPLVATETKEEQETAYEEALTLVAKYPNLIARLAKNKKQKLNEVRNARGHC